MRETVLLVVATLALVAGGPGCGSSDSGTETPQASPAANPAAPATSPVVGNLRLVKLEIGRSVNPDSTMHDATFLFVPTEAVWLSAEIDGVAPQAKLQARWVTANGQVVDQTTQDITPTGNATFAFHAARPDGWAIGKYRAEVLLNGVVAGSKDFEIRQPPL